MISNIPSTSLSLPYTLPMPCPMRLNQFIPRSGLCSRRKARELIKAGHIMVNGLINIHPGHIIEPGDQVKYQNQILSLEPLLYILLNKPKDCITTTQDPQNRQTVMDIIGGVANAKIYPVGRLDRNTTGVLLLTNHGELAKKLAHPSTNIQKTYCVSLDQPINNTGIQKIKKGLVLQDGLAIVDNLRIQTQDRKTLAITLHIGKNRIIKRIFGALGHQVKQLDRTQYAGLTYQGLSLGDWRFLNNQEIEHLIQITGLD